MKFPNIFNLREKKNPPITEVGATGTLFFRGVLAEEDYNPDLQGDKGLQTIEQMRRSDGQVKAALLACELPLRSAHWDIEAASDSKQDQEIAEFLRRMLFGGMTITWDDVLRHALLKLPFGFSVFEKVWELGDDNKYRWRKLAPRLPKSIFRFKLDPEGGLESVEQRAYKGDKFETMSIPVEKLLVFTNEREGSNYRGTSMLRAAYKHWYYKNQLYKIDGIAAERHGVGLPVFHYPPTATQAEKDAIGVIGEHLYVHERGFIALPENVKFDLTGVAGQLHDIKGSIEHHDIQIVRSILAQFINLGATDIGSYALSQDQSGFFLMALQALGRNICDTINNYGIRQLVDYNWDVEVYPKLTVSGLEYYDIAKYSTALNQLVTGGLLLPDRNIEAELRRRFHLPAPRAPEVGGAKELRLAEWQPTRPLRGAENQVAFSDIKDNLDSGVNKFVSAAKEVQTRQIYSIVSFVATLIEKGQMENMVEVHVSYITDMASAIEKTLEELYDYGKSQVKQELAKQSGGMTMQEGPLVAAGSKLAYLKARALATASILAAKLRAAIIWEGLHQIKAGTVDRAALVGTLTALSDKELLSTATFTISEAFNLGREEQAKEMGDEVGKVVYSALLDENTCAACEDMDGKEFDFPSGDWDEVVPPYKNCEGRDRCRCMGVYVYKAEKKSMQ